MRGFRRPSPTHPSGSRPQPSGWRLFQLTLLLVLWYQLAGLVFSRVLGIWPSGFEHEGFFIAAAALPWTLLALGFYAPTDAPLAAAVRDLLFFALIAFGIAINALVLYGMLAATLRAAARRQRPRQGWGPRTGERLPEQPHRHGK